MIVPQCISFPAEDHINLCLFCLISRQYQSQLPAAGVAVKQKKSSSTSTSHCEQLFEDYLKAQSRVNWKFWIVSFLKSTRDVNAI